ncbi:MAG TPA: protein kinase [Pirellulaceae bacterium]|nr:protein kinase [Pirellulaceae bacterium]
MPNLDLGAQPGDTEGAAVQQHRLVVEDPKALGSGLFGSVFRARDLQLDREVAVKVIRPDYLQQGDALTHAKRLARASHPNIVTIHYVDRVTLSGTSEFDGEHDAVVMELLHGQPLGKRLLAGLGRADAHAICSGMVEGIAHLHERQVVHGDLHHYNVFVCDNGCVKLIDAKVDNVLTLGALSGFSRDQLVEHDLDQLRKNIVLALQRSGFKVVPIAGIDTAMEGADVNGIREAVRQFFDGEFDSPASPATAGPSTPPDFATEVISLVESDRSSALRSYVIKELRRICKELGSDQFSPAGPFRPEIGKARIDGYDKLLSPIARGLALGVYYSTSDQSDLWRDAVEMTANVYLDLPLTGGSNVLLDLRLYPPTLLVYSIGFAAFQRRDFKTLYTLLVESKYRPRHGDEGSLRTELAHWIASSKQAWQAMLPDQSNAVTPVSRHLETTTLAAVEDLVTLPGAFKVAFDEFEYFFAAVECYYGSDPVWRGKAAWAPPGNYIWRLSGDGDLPNRMRRIATEKAIGPTMLEVFFDGNGENLNETLAALENFLLANYRDHYLRRRPE